MRLTLIKVSTATAIIVAIATIMWMGVVPSFAAERHVIKIEPNGIVESWSASGDLYGGTGQLRYHWEESNAFDGYVRWEFSYFGDNGSLDLDLRLGEHLGRFRSLSAAENHCIKVQRKLNQEIFPQITPCPFEGRGMG